MVALATSVDGTESLQYFARANNPTWAWDDPQELPGSSGRSYSGNPVLIQSSVHPGLSLDVFAPLASGGFGHWWHSDSGWQFDGVFESSLGHISALALIESSFGQFELLIRRGASLESLSRDARGSDTSWTTPQQIFDNAAGMPGFIQSNHGQHGNFEVVTPNRNGGLSGNWRNNDDPTHPRWMGAFTIVGHFGDARDTLSVTTTLSVSCRVILAHPESATLK